VTISGCACWSSANAHKTTRGRTEGRKGGTVPLAPNHWGAPKSPPETTDGKSFFTRSFADPLFEEQQSCLAMIAKAK